MPHRCLAGLLRLASLVAFSGALACAHAVELGEVSVRSYIGQPLVADIELTGFSGDGATVDARLARPDVFQGANIGIHPVLSSLRMSVMRRDGRQFLHITSIAPVQTQYVHLFLELGDGGRRNVRAASLSLAADPKPAPPPAAPAPHPVAVVLAPKPVAAVIPAPRPVAACPKPRYTDDEILACATRDYKNAMLSAQIVELEEKVRALQAALDVPPAVPAAAPALAHAVANVGKAPPPLLTVPAAKRASRPADASFPWVWVGGAFAALVAAGAAAVLIRNRRSKTQVVVLPRPKGKLLGRLRDALHRDKHENVES